MISVAKNNLCTNVVTQLVLVHSLHRADSAYRHEYRRLYVAVVGMYHTRTGIAAGGVEV